MCVFYFSCNAQNTIGDYAGLWRGNTKTNNTFNIDVIITEPVKNSASLILANDTELLNKDFKFKDTIDIKLSDKLRFKGIVNKENNKVSGFMKLGVDLYPVELKKQKNKFHGKLNLSANHYLQNESLFLEIRATDDSDSGYDVWPVLGTYWVNDFEQIDNNISFKDYKTGLLFKGELKPYTIELDISFGEIKFGKIVYHKVKNKGKGNKVKAQDGWIVNNNPIALPKLEDGIIENVLEGVESVLIAQNGEIQYENYFEGTNANTTNDLRSAGKSIGSAIIGIAIDDGIIDGTQEYIYKHLPKDYQYTKDSQKSKITIKQLLTMSSGIGVYEDDYQQSDDWLKEVLEPKLRFLPGTRTFYMSSDPFLLSVNLSERLSYPLEFYMQKKLFSPLGIHNYILNTDDKGNPYFAGGLYMTPRDMLKLGQLYLNNGFWNGKQIISKKWVSESFKKHTRLENASDKNEYGYFWWHDTYLVDGKAVNAIEARGNGGQYISVIPELDTVIVVTTKNYNVRRLSKQSEKIIENYILPILLK